MSNRLEESLAVQLSGVAGEDVSGDVIVGVIEDVSEDVSYDVSVSV